MANTRSSRLQRYGARMEFTHARQPRQPDGEHGELAELPWGLPVDLAFLSGHLVCRGGVYHQALDFVQAAHRLR
uniref:Uncharacterized protein n=1 Tax=Oryza barthii TaxID=65489 RepID=A0A0D3HNI9_9ORYZ